MSEKPKKKPRHQLIEVDLPKGRKIKMYFGTKVAEALEDVTEDMTLYKGVRLSQLLEAVYDQGMKDGVRRVFEEVDGIKSKIPHKNPGKPKKFHRKHRSVKNLSSQRNK